MILTKTSRTGERETLVFEEKKFVEVKVNKRQRKKIVNDTLHGMYISSKNTLMWETCCCFMKTASRDPLRNGWRGYGGINQDFLGNLGRIMSLGAEQNNRQPPLFVLLEKTVLPFSNTYFLMPYFLFRLITQNIEKILVNIPIYIKIKLKYNRLRKNTKYM